MNSVPLSFCLAILTHRKITRSLLNSRFYCEIRLYRCGETLSQLMVVGAASGWDVYPGNIYKHGHKMITRVIPSYHQGAES